MAFRSGHARGEQLARALGDERLVFAMRGDDDAQLLRQLQRAIQLRVVDAERAFVGEEDFERADAARDDLAELRLRRLRRTSSRPCGR